MRVFTEEDLEKAKAFFEQAGLPAKWVEVPHQGRTLHVVGCERRADRILRDHGAQAAPHRRVRASPRRGAAAARSFPAAGARRAEGVRVLDEHGLSALGVHFARRQRGAAVRVPAAQGQSARHRLRPGRRARGCITPPSAFRRSYHFFYVCDLAAEMGFAANIEFGPGRHGPGHALFVYLRDPDGHRIELFNTHYQVMDIENEPVRWDASYAMKRRWQLPARRQWYRRGEPLRAGRAARARAQGRSPEPGEIHRRRDAVTDSVTASAPEPSPSTS